jgi:hypothetical protein
MVATAGLSQHFQGRQGCPRGRAHWTNPMPDDASSRRDAAKMRTRHIADL